MYFKHCYQKHHALDSWKLYNIKIFVLEEKKEPDVSHPTESL